MTVIYEVPDDVVPLIKYIPTDILCNLLSELIKEKAYAEVGNKPETHKVLEEDVYKNMLEELKTLITTSSVQTLQVVPEIIREAEPEKQKPVFTFTVTDDDEEDLDEESTEAIDSFLSAILK